ncbi:MAG: hypothetical protein H0W89_01505 [Candidatus Levybacteria bacterium]|nr:hypothetical protein [Candidatus Levybacteria bacterium]
MKKYLLLAISFFLLTYLFFFPIVRISEAGTAELDQLCVTGPDLIVRGDSFECRDDAYCDTEHFDPRVDELGVSSSDPFYGICKSKTVLDCRCATLPGAPNGILCRGNGGAQDLPSACKDSAHICRDTPGLIEQADRVKRITLTPDVGRGLYLDGGTERFRGISCGTTVQPTCTCIGATNQAASGVNGIRCELPGLQPAEGYCMGSKACIPNGTMRESDVDRMRDGFLNPTRPGEDRGAATDEAPYRDADLIGVSCGAEQITCTCIGGGNTTGAEQNGIRCTNAAGAVIGEGYCSGSGDACVPSGTINQMDTVRLEDGQLNDNKGPLDESAMDNKDLIGVSCEALQATIAPTIPPPPPPPCAEWSDGGPGKGFCKTFATGFGDLGTRTDEFIQSLFAVLLSLSGGIALLLILKAGYQMMTSQGKPEQLQAGRDQLVAAIVGLIFLIFSFVILQIIGYDILQIPGFGTVDPGAP